MTAYIALFAAFVSAAVSIGLAIFTTKRAIRSEERSVTRTLLTEPVTEFFLLAHEAASSAMIAVKKLEQGQDPANWVKKCCMACQKLKENRLRLLIAAGALSEGLKTLSRLGNWLECKVRMDERKLAIEDSRLLLEAANQLKATLERELRGLLMSGQWLAADVHPECRNGVINMTVAWRRNASRTPVDDCDDSVEQ